MKFVECKNGPAVSSGAVAELDPLEMAMWSICQETDRVEAFAKSGRGIAEDDANLLYWHLDRIQKAILKMEENIYGVVQPALPFTEGAQCGLPENRGGPVPV